MRSTIKSACLALAVMLCLTACQALTPPPATSSLCGAIHPVKWQRVELTGMSTERLRELQGLNCSIERACGYPLDSACPKPTKEGLSPVPG